MTKKILSLALSVVLVMGLLPTMGLFPAMSVSAAGGSITFFDDFEAYDVDVYSDATQSAITELKDGNKTTWKIGKSAVAEILEMEGYDGKTTKVLKYSNTYAKSGEKIDTEYRLTAAPTGTNGADLAGKIFVQEVKVWIPEGGTLNDATDNELRPRAFFVGYGVYINGDNVYVGQSDISTGVKMPENQWVRFTVVLDYSEWEASGDNIGYTTYMNDVCIAKGVSTDTTKDAKIVKPSTSLNITSIANKYPQSDADYLDDYFIIDDVNQYHTPAATTASSDLEVNNTDVSYKINPTVNFTEKILEYAAHSDGEISVSKNIEFYKTEDPSVTVACSLDVSADGKTLTIDPASDLEKGVSYTLTVKNLKDMYGQNIASKTFIFTTAEDSSISMEKTPSFTRENLFQQGSTGRDISALENGYINVSYTVNNNSSTKSQDVIMLVVLKEGTGIKGFQFENGTLSPGASLTFNGGFYVDNAANQSIETYVWDSLYGMTPLTDKYVIDKDSITSTGTDEQ